MTNERTEQSKKGGTSQVITSNPMIMKAIKSCTGKYSKALSDLSK